MTRDRLFDAGYFDTWVEFVQMQAITPRKSSISSMPRPEGRIGRATDLWGDSVQLSIMRYSRGDAIADMRDSVQQMVELLELKHSTLASVELEKDVRLMYERLDLGILYESLTLLAFMVSLRLPGKDVLHALNLIGHASEDPLLDQVAHFFGDVSRKISTQSKFPKVYDAMVEVIAAPAAQRSVLLKQYVEGWYKRMKPIYWHDSHKGAEGAYFGYWCFEAALIAMLFEIDDSGLTDHPHYPADLVRHYRKPQS